jgi:hypothetical protein
MPHLQAPQYRWVCQYCGLSSPGGTLHCANCGFPAHTSAFELERAKRLGSVKEFLRERDLQRDDWRRKPLWKKALLVAAVPLFAAGVFLLEATSSWRSVALGAAMMGASLLLLWLGS